MKYYFENPYIFSNFAKSFQNTNFKVILKEVQQNLSIEITNLFPEIIRLFNEVLAKQLTAQQLLMNLTRPDETLDTIEKLTAQTAGFVGHKFDILEVYQTLEHESVKKNGATISETRQKAFEQQALRRLSEGDTPTEFMLGLLPSSQPGNVVELMLTYYKELIYLEKSKVKLHPNAWCCILRSVLLPHS